MAKDMRETVSRKMKEGWLKAWMAVEVLAVTREAAEKSLVAHVGKMEKEKSSIIYKKSFKETREVPHPFRKGEKAYSMVVEVEMVTRRFEDLFYMVMNYAPSGVEILEPENIKLELREAQGLLNSVSELIHKFAALGRGAVAIDA